MNFEGIRSFRTVFFVLIIVFNSCESSIPFKSKKDLIGNWNGSTIEITTPFSERTSFPINKYGYTNLSLGKKGSYEFTLTIIKDVVLEKEILGNSYPKILLKEGYKHYRTGYYEPLDDTLKIYDANKTLIGKEFYYFKERKLITEFFDKEKNHWKISWNKEN